MWAGPHVCYYFPLRELYFTELTRVRAGDTRSPAHGQGLGIDGNLSVPGLLLTVGV